MKNMPLFGDIFFGGLSWDRGLSSGVVLGMLDLVDEGGLIVRVVLAGEA
jgi:hypothetical protein